MTMVYDDSSTMNMLQQYARNETEDGTNHTINYTLSATSHAEEASTIDAVSPSTRSVPLSPTRFG